MGRVRSFFLKLGAFLLTALSFLALVAFARRKQGQPQGNQVDSAIKAVDQKAADAHAQVDAEAESKQDEVEVRHDEAVKQLESDTARRAVALRDSRAALAKALQRHARKPGKPNGEG